MRFASQEDDFYKSNTKRDVQTLGSFNLVTGKGPISVKGGQHDLQVQLE